MAAYEDEITRYALAALSAIPGITLYGSQPRVGVITFNLSSVPHAQLGSILCHEGGFGVRTGCFCAQTYVRRLLGINSEHSLSAWSQVSPAHWPGMVRISLAAYNTREEIDRLASLLLQISNNASYYKRLYPFSHQRQEFLPTLSYHHDWLRNLV